MYNYEKYTAVKAEIENRRIRAEAEADRRADEMRMRSPEIAEIDAELSGTGMKLFKAALAGEDLTPLRDRNQALIAKKKEMYTHEMNKMSKVMMSERKKLTSTYSGEDYMIEMYKSIVFDPSSQRHFATVFDVLANKAEGALLFHCTSGKDRTGITSLFLLTLLGVSEENILDDYEISNVFNAKYIKSRELLMKLFLPTSKRFKKLLSVMLYTKREYMVETIKAINNEFGSVLNFMYEKLDITPEKHEKIKKLYLE